MKTIRSARKPAPQRVKGIYLRKKQGVGVFWFGRMEGGRRVQVSLGTSDFSEAVQKALAIRANPFLAVGDAFGDEITAFVAHKVRANEYSRNSAETKVSALREFSALIGKEPAAVQPADVQRYYEHARSRVAESTAQGYLMTVRSFFNWLLSRKVIRENPVQGVKLARVDRKGRKKFCTPELRDKLIAECPREDLRFALFCGFHAGLRKEEIVEARGDWFDLSTGLLNVPLSTETFRPKDREERTIPLTSAFKEFLAKFGLHSPFMLHQDVKQGKARYRWDFRRPWEDYMKAQDCEWVTPHVMRHTFASLLASRNVSLYKIAKWMGDEERTVQRHYAKLLPKDDDIEKAFA